MWITIVAVALAAEPLAGVPMAVAADPNATAMAPSPTVGAALAPNSPNVDAGGVVIKTWGFLRETTDALGSHAQDVLRVRKDLEDMAADEAEQRKAWSAASQEVANQNRALAAKVAAQTADPTNYEAQVSQLQTELTAAQEKQRLARQNATTLTLTWQGKEKAHIAQVAALTARVQQVHTQMTLEQESSVRALNAARLSQHALETQVHQLEQQIALLKQQEMQLAAEAQQNVTMLQDQQSFLARQGQAVKGDLPKVHSELLKTPELQSALHTQQGDLAQVQTELATSQGECAMKLHTLHDVIRAEQAKVAARSSEVARCSSVGAQNAWLSQQITEKCPSASAFGA